MHYTLEIPIYLLPRKTFDGHLRKTKDPKICEQCSQVKWFEKAIVTTGDSKYTGRLYARFTYLRETMKIVAIVPMKLNNRRLPGKNTKKFTNGDPLCTYILRTLLSMKEVDEIYVYCSDSSIKDYLPDGVKYLKRSKSLDTDSSSMLDVLDAFCREVPADIYLLTHATAPFITAESMKKGLNAVTSGKYDSSFAVKKIQDFIWKDGKPFNYSLENIPRTQDLPEMMMETCGFYIFGQDVIKYKKRRIGDRPLPIEVSEIESIDIDEKEDFELADAWYNYSNMMHELRRED